MSLTPEMMTKEQLWDTIEALRGEVERLKEERDAAITDRFDAAADRIKVVAAERDRLKAALEEAVKWIEGCAVGGGYPAWYAKARKALAGEKT